MDGQLLFALVVGLFLSPLYGYLLWWLCRKACDWNLTARNWGLLCALFGLLFGALDLLENIAMLATVALHQTGNPIPEWLTRFSWWLAITKFLFFCVSLLNFIGGLIRTPGWGDIWRVARDCSVCLFCSLALPGMLFFGGQGAELLNILRSSPLHFWLWTFLALLIFPLSSWRMAMTACSTTTPDLDTIHGRATLWIPRLCAYLPCALFVLIAWESHAIAPGMLTATAGALAAFAVYFARLHPPLKDAMTLVNAVVIGLMLLATACPLALQYVKGIGPIAAWLFAGNLLIFTFTLLREAGKRTGWPVMGIVLTFGFLFNALDLNDNHGVRYNFARTGISPEKATLRGRFAAWLKYRRQVSRWPADKPYPVIFVAAEGGGIRAAAQSATLLLALEESGLNNHVFAISGVSGGSVGAAIYAALMRDLPGKPLKRQEASKSILTSDLLSPTVAAMLSSEMLQRFLPFAVPDRLLWKGEGSFWLDRGQALDRAVESAYDGVVKGETSIRKPLESNVPPIADNQPPVPALFLNASCVETGERLVLSSLRTEGIVPFETQRTLLNDLSVMTSTAACLSARFPLFSPPGWIPQVRETDAPGSEREAPLKVKRSYVDGGYFDNMGTATVTDLLQALSDGPPLGQWTPLILVVRYDERYVDMDDFPGRVSQERSLPDSPLSAPDVRPLRRSIGFDEITGPLGAFMAGWGGHPRTDLSQLRSRYGSSVREVVFGKGEGRRRSLPLGWYLAADSYERIVEQSDKGAEEIQEYLISQGYGPALQAERNSRPQ